MFRAIKSLDGGIQSVGNRWSAYASVVALLGLLGGGMSVLFNWARPFFPEAWGWPEAIVLGVGSACILLLVASACMIAWRYFFPIKEPAHTYPTDQALYAHDPAEEAPDRVAYFDLMAFTLSVLEPACRQQIELQKQLLIRVAKNDRVADFAIRGLQNDYRSNTRHFWTHYNNLMQGIDRSEPTIKFTALIDCIKGLEKNSYRDFCAQADELAASARIDLKTDNTLGPIWEEWRDCHSDLVRAYDKIKRDVRLGALFRPLREPRWGGIVQMVQPALDGPARDMTFAELIRHAAKHYPELAQVEQEVRNTLFLEELVGVGYGYDRRDPDHCWETVKSKIPPGFWKLAEFEVVKILNGHSPNEIGVLPPDSDDSFQAFERGVEFENAGEIPLYKDITFKAEDVRRVWPPN